MKADPGIDAVRRAREEISHEAGNDPATLVDRYIELQKRFQDRLKQSSAEESSQITEDAAQ